MSLILKRSYLNSFLVFLFLLASLLFGSFIIGPVSLRIYVSCILLLVLLIFRYRFSFSKEIKLYLAFIGIYFFALLINGEIKEVNFLKYYFGRYFVCLIAVYIISSLVNSSTEIKRTIVFLILVGIVNGIFSIMQYYGSDLGTSIPKVLINAEGTEDLFANSISFESGLNRGVRGLFGFIARNGYFSAVFACLAPLLISISLSNFQRLISAFISVFLIYVVFLTQQRLVLLLVLAFYFVLLLGQRKYFLYALLALIGFIIILITIDYSLEYVNLGRYADYSDSNRLELYSLALKFIKDNFWFGGQNAFTEYISGKVGLANSAHNFFLNGFIYSGVIGAIVVSLLYFRILIRSLRPVWNFKSNDFSHYSKYLGGALVIYMLNSLTHNASLITGDEFIWILFVLLVKSDIGGEEMSENVSNETPTCNR